MITVLTGDNTFEIDRALQVLIDQFAGAVEKIDGSVLGLQQLPDLVMGGTLFATNRFVVMRSLSENKAVWPVFSDWVERVSEDVQLVLVEPKLDKRTKTYKTLQKMAELREFSVWSERDTGKAEQWVMSEMTLLGGALDKKCAQLLVARVGVDQWALYQALQKLALLDAVTPEIISTVIEASPAANVFELFESALRGNRQKVAELMATVSLTEDPYRLMGLLSGQAFQVAALAVTDEPAAVVAKQIGAHPFALGKLTAHAKRLGRPGTRQVIAAFAEADTAMKTSVAEPWLAIERALLKVAAI